MKTERLRKAAAITAAICMITGVSACGETNTTAETTTEAVASETEAPVEAEATSATYSP